MRWEDDHKWCAGKDLEGGDLIVFQGHLEKESKITRISATIAGAGPRFE